MRDWRLMIGLVGLVSIASVTGVSAARAAAAPLPQVDSAAFAGTQLTLENGIVGERLMIDSRSPADFKPLLAGELGPAVRLSAQLFRPRASGHVPAVVMLPGSGNIGPHHLEQAAALTSAGIAVLLLDPFTGRGIASTVTDQAQLGWAAATYDVAAAVRTLRAQPGIDARRVGAVGSSRGGTAVMLAMDAGVSKASLGTRGILAGFAGYPWCGLQFWRGKLAAGSRLLVVSGDSDGWVSVQQCQDAVHALSQTGDATIRLVPGALHAFDRRMPPTPLPEAPTSTSFPTVYMADDGTYLDPATGRADQAVTAASFTKHAVDGGFVRRGVTIGSQGHQADRYVAEMVAYLTEALHVDKGGSR